MKVVILAGGKGTRLAEFTDAIPKPMVPIHGEPILIHLMRSYAVQGFNDFVIATGHKGEVIKQFFASYATVSSDFEVNLSNGRINRLATHSPDWKVRLVDTGVETLTGGRLKRLKSHIGDEKFMMTYGDGLANVDLNALLNFHLKAGKLATITAVRPPARFGELVLDGDVVHSFEEKPQLGGGWINGGFFVLEPSVLDLIEGDHQMFEREPLVRLSHSGQLSAFRHEGFWQCMDTRRDREFLESLDQIAPPWAHRA